MSTNPKQLSPLFKHDQIFEFDKNMISDIVLAKYWHEKQNKQKHLRVSYSVNTDKMNLLVKNV